MRRIILILWPFILATLVFLSVRLAIHNPGLVEIYYSESIYPLIAKSFSLVSNLIPFSLWDSFWLLTILLIISGLFLAGFKKIKFSWLGLRIAQFLAILYSFFYIVWGFNYFRPTIETRIGWKNQKAEEAIFRSILDTIIIHTNSSHSSISRTDYLSIDELVEKSYLKNSSTLGIRYPNGTRRPKTMLLSSFISKMGVNGYFGPFFNEIHLNYYMFPVDYPFILAHEKAHQFGIASEAEANLAAFVICTTSDDKRLQYSGYVYVMLYFLSDAGKLTDVKDYMNKIDKQVMMDLQYRRSYYLGLQKKTLKKVQVATNNAYLKTNHIENGVRNYNQVVALTISWYRNLKLNEEKKY
jgi:hypothetical protein